MKILHILDHSIPLQSGYTYRTLGMLRSQHRMGWNTAHITSTKHTVAQLPEEIVDGLLFYRTLSTGSILERLPIFKQWMVIRLLRRRIEQVVDKERPAILHAHSPALNGMAALAVARRRAIPLAYEMRASWEDAAVDHGRTREGSLRYRSSRALETYVLRRADAITTISEGLQRDIIARNIRPEAVSVVPNAVDVERFGLQHHVDTELVAQLGLAGKVVLGFIGSFYAYEGLALLLSALPLLLRQAPEVRVLLVGGGFQEDALKLQVKAMAVSEQVIFVGRVPHEQVHHYYRLIDIFVYPRLSNRLTELVTPLKPLEAMAEGRLIVASDVGGHRELIQDGENGVLFRAGSEQALADAVLNLIARPERWNGLRCKGRRYVETERSWLKVSQRYRGVYASLLPAGALASV